VEDVEVTDVQSGDAPVSAQEQHAWAIDRAVVGIDEVGRGALAGPVTVAAVVLHPIRLPAGVRDSKRLTPVRRERVAAAVHEVALIGLGRASNDEIDEVGLATALTRAVRRAYDAVMATPGAPTDPLVLIDGPHDLLRVDGVEVATLVRGDAAAISIAAASVVAKVDRDMMMAAVDPEYPEYGFARNRGYASPEHLAALTRRGPCALHRQSWAPIARLVQPTLAV
jgi:ribonuclease HII